MDEPEVELVEPQTLTINFPSVGSPMAIRAKGKEIVVLVRFALRPRDNVMNIDIDVSAGGDGATVSSLDKDSPAQFSGYWRAPSA